MIQTAQMTIIGNITADPEAIETRNGRSLCKFTVAVNRRIGEGEERTSFIPVLVANDEVNACMQYLSKGRQVMVNGIFETDKYVDSEGITRTGFTCVVNKAYGHVEFGVGGRRNDSDGYEEERSSGYAPKAQRATKKLSNRMRVERGR